MIYLVEGSVLSQGEGGVMDVADHPSSSPSPSPYPPPSEWGEREGARRMCVGTGAWDGWGSLEVGAVGLRIRNLVTGDVSWEH